MTNTHTYTLTRTLTRTDQRARAQAESAGREDEWLQKIVRVHPGLCQHLWPQDLAGRGEP